jgi:transposase
MAKPYSEDLRRRVVGTIEGGTTIPEAAEQCGVSISSVVRFLKLHRETGSVESAKFGGYAANGTGRSIVTVAVS